MPLQVACTSFPHFRVDCAYSHLPDPYYAIPVGTRTRVPKTRTRSGYIPVGNGSVPAAGTGMGTGALKLPAGTRGMPYRRRDTINQIHSRTND